jgi:predicted nuclease of predicted toxin-antitoxin system
MTIYLDEDIAAPLLARLLRNAGHDVQLPADVGMIGEEDPVAFTHAIQDNRVLLTHNYTDFENLHNLILAAAGRHPGILVERFDNLPKHNLTPAAIIRALRNLLATGLPLTNRYEVLNRWQ